MMPPERLVIAPPGLLMAPELDIVPLLLILPSFVRVPPELMVMVPVGVTFTVYPDWMVTMIPLGIVTVSDGPGSDPPHVVVSFQFPLDTAVKDAA